MYHAQWKRVQYLADVFWRRWRIDYLQSLQSRRKWIEPSDNLSEGDIVLLKDKQVNRLSWPMGIIVKVFPSSDKLVRKAEVQIARTIDNNCVKKYNFVRPVTELVVLLPKKVDVKSNLRCQAGSVLTPHLLTLHRPSLCT